ncbi:MAG: hypothetical protein R3C05_12300 [Pirellulaceae bacterium]
MATDDGDLNDNGILDLDDAVVIGPVRQRVQEVTGLNRMLGSEQADELYGGTTLDFMYGNGGDARVVPQRWARRSESLDGSLAGDEWKEYAKESDQVWYVGGTNARIASTSTSLLNQAC